MTKKAQVLRVLIAFMKTGVLNVGDKLPSLREISLEQGVSISTSLDAYNDLVSYEIVESRPKNGYFVISTDNALLDDAMRKLSVEAFPDATRIDHEADEMSYIKHATNALFPFSNDYIQLASDSVSEKYFSADALNRRMLRTTKNSLLSSLQHNINETSPELALEISKLVYPIKCLLQRKIVVVTTNVTEAIMLAIRVCSVPGGTIGVESPGHRAFFKAAMFLNMNCVEIESDPVTGLSPSVLQSHIDQGVKLSCLLLSSHNSPPTGAIIPDENKAALLDICVRNSIPIIENDDMGWFSFSPEQHHPLKSFDHTNVIYISGFKELLGDDYGLAWIEGGKYAERFSYIKGISGVKTPYSIQASIAAFLTSHPIEAYISGLNQSIKASTELFYRTFKEYAPESIELTPLQGGPFLWVELPCGFSADDFSDYAADCKVFVAAGSLFSSLAKSSKCFRVNCCTSGKPEGIIRAAKALAEILTKYII